MTTQRHQDTTSFTRPRRLTVAFALSIGAGSLVYGTALAFPAAAASASPSPSCGSTATASASPSKSATGTDSPTASGSDSISPTATPSSAATGSTSGSSSAGGTGTGTGTATASASPTATATTCATATQTATKTATASASVTASASASASPSKSRTTTPTPTATPTKKKTTAAATTSAAQGGGGAQPSNAGISSIPVFDGGGGDTYFAYTDVPPGDAGSQLPHGSITRAQIIARAELWVQAQVPYSQTSWYTNQNGTYRQDCSGYVSMAWDLDQNTDFWTGNLNLVSHTIDASELLPGDILLSQKHTILFASWADSAHTQFNYFEEAHPGTVARYVEDAPLSAFLDNGFAPFRYDGVLDSGALPPDPSSGQLYATLSQLASEIDPPGVSTVAPLGLNGSGPAAGAAAGATATRISAQVAADDMVSSEGAHSEGMVIGVSGVFLIVAGLLLRRPFSLHRYRRRH